MQDGFQLVARIPYCSTEPRQLLVASEVATLNFLRSNGIPVPEVYGYSHTTENPVGSEYIFLEFIRGINLADIWHALPENASVKVVKELAEFESKLLTIRFATSGSLYSRQDLDPSMNVDVAATPSLAGQYCVGPDTSSHLWYGKRLNLRCRRGPCESFTSFLLESDYLTRPLRLRRRGRNHCGCRKRACLSTNHGSTSSSLQ